MWMDTRESTHLGTDSIHGDSAVWRWVNLATKSFERGGRANEERLAEDVEEGAAKSRACQGLGA